MSPIVYLALGSNLGDRLENLRTALASLPPEVQVLEQSPVYETPPWGYLDQPAFLNQVIEAQTDLSAQDLLAYVKRIEAEMGRKKTILNGPRLIDLDILFYDRLVYSSPELTVPHPRMAGRAFVLVPMADLAPDWIHPLTGQTIRQMATATDRAGMVEFASKAI